MEAKRTSKAEVTKAITAIAKMSRPYEINADVMVGSLDLTIKFHFGGVDKLKEVMPHVNVIYNGVQQ